MILCNAEFDSRVHTPINFFLYLKIITFIWRLELNLFLTAKENIRYLSFGREGCSLNLK